MKRARIRPGFFVYIVLMIFIDNPFFKRAMDFPDNNIYKKSATKGGLIIL
jgi:hypothetical protein